ncbi:Uncharacterised protein [Salmonella enterica subsp. enterica serovar Bovismorbificans]|uniref:Uncharacterized protein n=1 Tax=Salmonella enterica subsp. enterica serovar Bovismorbificans TaxID=58097 RepID=A0A655BVI8_SALET|nr:Uncharacterised protein [Salmonella enterica subsp. enterica serovar Bovismorbificans]CNU79630.1 Uncharacterised protein [Salmonella enterica subsp. enterica serovar Bovismorbificans]CQB63021.1 Uncharacterised protein [Salmonella enterica subsp. enterica serovar Bovismorbificans]
MRERITGIAASWRDKKDMNDRTLRRFIIRQYARITQSRAQRHRKFAAELHQFFTFIGVGDFNSQLAALFHYALQHADNRRNSVFRR